MTSVGGLLRSFDTVGSAAVRIGIPEGIVEVDARADGRVEVEVTMLRGDARAL